MAKRGKSDKSGRPELLVTRFLSLLLLLKHERPAARIAICPVRPCLYRLKAALYGCALARQEESRNLNQGSGGEQIDDPLDRSVGAVVGGFEFAGRLVGAVGAVMEAAVGKR